MDNEHVGIILVDHGSRLPEGNRLLDQMVAAFAQRFVDRWPIVEPAHMELAEPTVSAAYARCVERGARRIVVALVFLGPGKHATTNIPELAAAAAAAHPGTSYRITAPLGLDALLLDLLAKRVAEVGD